MKNNLENIEKEELLDIQSPYIKNNIQSIEEVRERIAKRASNPYTNKEENLLFIDGKESDDLLKQKIVNISKKIAGDEIRKFAEIAGKEISNEFKDLEIKLDNKITDNLQKVNNILSEMENRIKDLEVFISSNQNETKSNENKTNHLILQEEIENKKESEKPLSFFQKYKNTTKEKEVEKDENFRDEKKEEESFINIDEYIERKINNISIQFEKNGSFFRKNIFISKLKRLITEEFLNDVIDEEIEKQDKDKMKEILLYLMDTLNIDPNEDENIGSFLKRAFKKEFELKNIKSK